MTGIAEENPAWEELLYILRRLTRALEALVELNGGEIE